MPKTIEKYYSLEKNQLRMVFCIEFEIDESFEIVFKSITRTLIVNQNAKSYKNLDESLDLD